MSKEEKIIKDLKERNRSLNNQFRLRDIRVNILEQREIEKSKEIERLNNIINEAIKYIEDSSIWFKENPECDYILHLLKGGNDNG